MKLTFRWYGEDDPVTLENISQIPLMSGIVSAVYDVKPGEVWSNESIRAVKQSAAAHGLAFEVVESVPVTEEIKYGGGDYKRHIENYCENIRRLGKAGVRCVCYNFMPVFDWLRSELEHKNADGSFSLAYNEEELISSISQKDSLSLPGWDESYSKDELDRLMEIYSGINEDKLFDNLEVFLRAVIPVCEESGVNMAIHPDDPPWGVLGLPRIITNEKNIERLFGLVRSRANGLTFCTGSLGSDPANDLVKMADKFADRIHFLHLRNVKITGERSFCEVGHPSGCGSFDMYKIVKTLTERGFDGYVRPDHGRMIWQEKGRYGYGLFDRALGAAYINGLFEAAEKEKKI